MKAAQFPPTRALVLLALVTVLTTGASLAQTDDFDDNNDNGWTRLDPLAEVAPPSVASFSADGGEYRISSPATPVPAAGDARAGSLREEAIYADFCVVVDIVDFDPILEQSIGILARIQPNPGLGAVDGYILTIQASTQDMDISILAGEQPSALDANVPLPIPLDPQNTYRMVFLGRGSLLEGRLYDTTDLQNPIAVVTADDFTYSMGTCGLVVADLASDPSAAIDATFDNYFANDGTPPQLVITKDAFDEGTLVWPDNALCFKLQTSTSLSDNAWTDVTTGIQHQELSKQFIVALFFFDGNRQRYWRLVPTDGM